MQWRRNPSTEVTSWWRVVPNNQLQYTGSHSHFLWPINSRFEMAWKNGLRKWKRNCSVNYISNSNNHTHILRIKFSGLFHSFSVLFSYWEEITMSHLYNSLKVRKRKETTLLVGNGKFGISSPHKCSPVAAIGWDRRRSVKDHLAKHHVWDG